MGFVFILPIAAAGAWILGTTLRQIFRERTGSARTRIIVTILLVGTALGIWLCFFLKYRPNANYHLSGFPIPLEFSQLKNDVWVDSVKLFPVRIGTIIANFLFALAIPCLPIKISFFLNQFRGEGPDRLQ